MPAQVVVRLGCSICLGPSRDGWSIFVGGQSACKSLLQAVRLHDDLVSLGLLLDGGSDVDYEALDELSQWLHAELLALEVRSVDLLRAGNARVGTRGFAMLAVGGLLVTLAQSGDTLKMAIGVIQSFLRAQPTRSVELSNAGDPPKMSGISSAEQHQVIELFVQRHNREAGGLSRRVSSALSTAGAFQSPHSTEGAISTQPLRCAS